MTEISFDRCPLCGETHAPLYELSHARLVRCEADDCGLIYAEAQPSDARLTELYNSMYYVADDTTTSKAEKQNSDTHKFRQHFQALTHRMKLRNSRLLDYGCGIGNFLEVARDGGAEANGIEVNERARLIARGKGFRIEKSLVDFADLQFDFVYMNDVIEHLRDPVSVLREISRHLSPNGKLFVVTMNMDGLKARLLGKRWGIVTDPTHFYFYNRQSLRRTLFESGYQSIHEDRLFVNFSAHGILRRILQHILVRTGMDAGLKMLAGEGAPPETGSLAVAEAEHG